MVTWHGNNCDGRVEVLAIFIALYFPHLSWEECHPGLLLLSSWTQVLNCLKIMPDLHQNTLQTLGQNTAIPHRQVQALCLAFHGLLKPYKPYWLALLSLPVPSPMTLATQEWRPCLEGSDLFGHWYLPRGELPLPGNRRGLLEKLDTFSKWGKCGLWFLGIEEQLSLIQDERLRRDHLGHKYERPRKQECIHPNLGLGLF